jgi:hypothetical protein
MTEPSPLLVTCLRAPESTVSTSNLQVISCRAPNSSVRAFTALLSPPTFAYFSQHSSISQKANDGTTIVGQQKSTNTRSHICADWTGNLHHNHPFSTSTSTTTCELLLQPSRLNTPIPQYLASKHVRGTTRALQLRHATRSEEAGSRGLPYSAPFSAGPGHSFISPTKTSPTEKSTSLLQTFYNYNNYDLTTTALTHTKSFEETATIASTSSRTNTRCHTTGGEPRTCRNISRT